MPSNNEIPLILITTTLLVVILAGFIIVLVKLFDKAKKNFALERENINKEFETQLLKTQLEIQEQTFQNISQEIHDNIGQALTFVKLSINTIDVHKIEETQNKLQESKHLITKTIQDLRNLSKTLNTGFINDAGLPASIEYQLSFLQKTGVYETDFRVSGEVFKNKPLVELVAFRVIQELINNIIKHAGANFIEITLDYQRDRLTARVRDNGKGFDRSEKETGSNGKGLGLKNIRDRIAMIQGEITLDSTPGEGTQVIIEVPRQD